MCGVVRSLIDIREYSHEEYGPDLHVRMAASELGKYYSMNLNQVYTGLL